MKKILLFVEALVFLFASTTMTAIAWWNITIENISAETLELGYGVTLTLYDQVVESQGKKLVPVGSYYSNKSGYVTEYVLDYYLTIDGVYEEDDLLVSISDIKVGDLNYDNSPNIHGPLKIEILSSSDSSNIYTVNSYNDSTTFEKVLRNNETEIISIKFSLLDDDTELISESDLYQAYNNLAGKTISFNLTFEALLNAN